MSRTIKAGPSYSNVLDFPFERMEAENPANMCLEHRLFQNQHCVDCKKFICPACIAVHSRQKHEVIYITEYSERFSGKKLERIEAMIRDNSTVLDASSHRLQAEFFKLQPEVVAVEKRLEELLYEAHKSKGLLACLRSNTYKPEDFSKSVSDRFCEMRKSLKSDKAEVLTPIAKELDDLERLMLLLLNFGDAFSSLRGEFEAFKRLLEKDSTLQMLSSSVKLLGSLDWTLDQEFKNPQLKLSGNSMTVERTGGDGHTTILGTKGFSNGIHEWNVRFDYPVTAAGCIKSHWAGIGVIRKEDVNASKTDTFDRIYGVSTEGGKHNVLGSATQIPQGSVCKVVLDLEKGTLSITGPGVDLKAENLKGMTLYPYFGLYTNENKLTVLK